MAYYVLVSEADILVSHIIKRTCSDYKYTTLAINFKAFLPLPLMAVSENPVDNVVSYLLAVET